MKAVQQPLDIAKSISHGLARNVISAKFDGKIIEATRLYMKMVNWYCSLLMTKMVKKPYGTALLILWLKLS